MHVIGSSKIAALLVTAAGARAEPVRPDGGAQAGHEGAGGDDREAAGGERAAAPEEGRRERAAPGEVW